MTPERAREIVRHVWCNGNRLTSLVVKETAAAALEGELFLDTLSRIGGVPNLADFTNGYQIRRMLDRVEGKVIS
jgi:hypothetical protein